MTDYGQPLREQDVDPHPLRQFALWFGDAAAAGLRLPEAAALATASVAGVPSVRMVLVKEFDERGFVFYYSCVVLGVPVGLDECGGLRCLRSEPVGRAEKTPGGGVRRPREGAGGGGMTRTPAGPYWCLCVDPSPAATAPDAAVTS
jgi:pyridoxamine 5'-phosphate oxidase